jgi:rhamnosyltransferase
VATEAPLSPSRISVLIPVKDGADTLPQLLDALASQQTKLDVETFAIDSGSRDGSVELMKERGLRVESIASSAFDHGDTRNRAIAGTSGDIAVLLTQDAIPSGPRFLDAIAAPFSDPDVAGVYGRQIPRSDCDVLTQRQLEGWLTGRTEHAYSSLGGKKLVELSPGERHALCVFDNVCSAVRRSTWEKLPFPRTEFGEDIAWGKSVIEAGHTIAYTPDASVIHSHRRSIFYEYSRTRICHQKLNELFDLATVPRPRDVARAVAFNWRNDVPYVSRQPLGRIEKLRQLGRTVGLSALSPIAQYQGIRDARRRR